MDPNVSSDAEPPKTDSVRAPNVIMTPCLFPLMDLPTELRLKILNYVLLSPQENITIDSTKSGASILTQDPHFERPSVTILQTCKLINEEGTPVLYSKHVFTIHLPLGPHPTSQNSAFFLRPMRWSTIACINTMYFTSSTATFQPLPTNSQYRHESPHQRPRTVFSCSAAHLLSRYTATDFKYAPRGPNEYAVLSMSNYVSTQVMKEELSAFQIELEGLMRPGVEYGDGPAS